LLRGIRGTGERTSAVDRTLGNSSVICINIIILNASVLHNSWVLRSPVHLPCVAVRTAFSYISPADYDEKTAKSFEKVADENIKDGSLRRPEILQAFAQLVCEGYVSQRPVMPESITRETDECFDEEDEEIKIKGLFEDAGDDPQHFLKCC